MLPSSKSSGKLDMGTWFVEPYSLLIGLDAELADLPILVFFGLPLFLLIKLGSSYGHMRSLT